MKKCLSVFLSFNLFWTTSASATTLEGFSRALTTSSTMDEFIEKTVPNKIRQKELKELVKVHPTRALPKSSFEKGILTLKEDKGARMTVEVIDASKGEFKFNGQKVVVERQDSYLSIIHKVDTALKTKTSLWKTFMPEAQAQLKWVFLTVVGAIIGTQLTSMAVANDCNEMVDFFRDNLKTQAKTDNREILPKSLKCNAESAEADFVDRGLKLGQNAKVVYSKKTGSQEGFVQIIVVDSKPTQNITYNFMQGKDNMEPKLEGTYINGEPVTDPQALEFHKKQFQIYRNSMGPLLYSVGKRCYECKPEEIAQRLEHRGFFEKKNPVDTQVMPSVR